MTFQNEKVGIVGHFQEKVGKSRSKSKKQGKVGPARKPLMDFMPCKGEHETGIFCDFYWKSGAMSRCYVHVDMMSHINRNKYKMVEQRLCS